MFGYIISLIVVGLVIGVLARLVVPGRQAIGILATIALGIVGAFIGGLITTNLLHAGTVVGLIVSVLVAALLIGLFTRGHDRGRVRL